jgi:hypothetical protein
VVARCIPPRVYAMNRLWALQILYGRASGPSLFIRLFRDNLMMPVHGLCSVQTLDSSTSCGSEPMAYDKLVILHYDHIGSLCVSNRSSAGPEPAKVGALFASASTSEKTNAPSEGVSGGSTFNSHPSVMPVISPMRK